MTLTMEPPTDEELMIMTDPPAEPKSNEVARAAMAVFVFLGALAVGIVFVVISPNWFGLLMFLLFFVGGMVGGYQVRKR